MNEPVYNYKRLLAKTLLTVAAFVAAFITFSVVFREPLAAFSHSFVDVFGGAAVPLGFFLVSAFLLPLPDDAFSAFALMGGMHFFSVVGLAVFGSVLGASVAYSLGSLLRHTAVYQRLINRHRAKAEYLINTYGSVGLALAALTPIPDSPVSWVCGGLGLPFRKFFPIYLVCRAVKITYALWLVQLGLRVTGL